ncbi:hypothetical protein [Salibacterium salarium]|uniref:hypothetical protein n=1 Tax=Salibacterium salarium TaxID=284579 RepID=UPI0027D7D378|nr:hypothetical protein [Salibacterium salarium]
MAVVVIVRTVKKAPPLYRSVGLVFLLLGLIVVWTEDLFSMQLLTYFNSLMGLLALFFILPFMNAVIRIGLYDKTLSRMIGMNTSDVGALYKKTSFATYVLTIFLNVATVPVIVSAVRNKIRNFGTAFSQSFFTHSILRPYALVLFWSPTEILLALTLDTTGQNYLLLLPVLWLNSLLFLGIDWAWHKRKWGSMELHDASHNTFSTDNGRMKKKGLEMGAAILIFVVLVLIGSEALHLGFLLVVTIAIIPFSLVWALAIKKGKMFSTLGYHMAKQNTSKLHGLFFLFLSAGFFVELMPYTRPFEYINTIIQQIYTSNLYFLLFLVIGMFIFVLAFAGFHPLVTIALLVPFIDPFIQELTFGLSLTILSSAICTLMIGPFNVTPAVLGMYINMNPYKVSLKNIGFAFLFMMWNIVMAYGITLILR